MDENEKAFEERLNEIDFSKDYPDYEFLSKIEDVCSKLYPQFNKEEYSNLLADQKRTGYEKLVRDKFEFLNSMDIEKHSIFINEIIEIYKLKIVI